MENQSADEVGAAFCDSYYKLLQCDTNLLSGFYHDPTDPESHNTVRGIDHVLSCLNIYDYNVVIRTIDSQLSINNGILVLVSGSFVRAADNYARNFSQTFFLASRPSSADGTNLYVVQNDIFSFYDNDDSSSLPMPAASELTAPVGKNSFASVVHAMKRNPAPMQVRAPQPKSIEQHQAKPEPASPAAAALTMNLSVGKKTESAPAESHSIFVPSLPLHATVDDLDKVFKQFGPIKTGGIQVRSRKQHGICFGFVEYESASSVESALKASPIALGSRNLFIQEKRATKGRPNFGNRGNYNKNHSGGYKEVSGRA